MKLKPKVGEVIKYTHPNWKENGWNEWGIVVESDKKGIIVEFFDKYISSKMRKKEMDSWVKNLGNCELAKILFNDE